MLLPSYCSKRGIERGRIPVVQKDPHDTASNSDIVITATTSKVPVFKDGWLRDGTHINAIGSHHGPGIKELDEETIRRARIVVD